MAVAHFCCYLRYLVTPTLKTHRKIYIFKELMHFSREVFNFLGSSLAWPPRMAWTKAEVGQGLIWVKKLRKSESSQNWNSIVESLRGPQESILNLSRGPQLHFHKKTKKGSNYLNFVDFPLFPLFGVPWAAVILSKHLVCLVLPPKLNSSLSPSSACTEGFSRCWDRGGYGLFVDPWTRPLIFDAIYSSW